MARRLLFVSLNDGACEVDLTCRIDRLSTEQGLVLYISGRLAAEDIEVLRASLDECQVVAIELAEVELVSRDAVKLLAQTEAKGIELRSCPGYIREWVTSEREIS